MYIVCNWKAHGSVESVEHFQNELRMCPGFHRIIFCPPFPYISMTQGMMRGAQDVSCHENGSYTGDVTAAMLKDIKVAYALIGHSERRFYHHENDNIVIQKAQQLLKHHITPIICVGEKYKNDDIDVTELIKPYRAIYNTWIAYEPMWAIGTQNTPTSSHIDHVAQSIKSMLKNTVVLYGGSVSDANIEMLMEAKHIDGFLIGKASLDPISMIKILEKLYKARSIFSDCCQI